MADPRGTVDEARGDRPCWGANCSGRMRFWNDTWWVCDRCGNSQLERSTPIPQPEPSVRWPATVLVLGMLALWALALLLLPGCAASPDSLCAKDCIARGRQDGCFDGYRCVCIVLEEGEYWEGECEDAD